MSNWLPALLLAVLIATIPFTLIASVLARLPRPLASSHGQWPSEANGVLIGVVTAAVTIFIHSAYYGGAIVPSAFAARFLVIALIYTFGLTLLLRQYAGVYAEVIITIGWMGLGLRKTTYNNILRVEQISANASETRLRLETARSGTITLTLPNRDVAIFQEQMRKVRESHDSGH